MRRGAQAYWVCPSIDSEDGQLVSATFTHQRLTNAWRIIRLASVHGRMSSQEKQTVMREFKEGKISVLVSTTVIEVGVDVPNAILMIIENAERFGLTQFISYEGG